MTTDFQGHSLYDSIKKSKQQAFTLMRVKVTLRTNVKEIILQADKYFF